MTTRTAIEAMTQLVQGEGGAAAVDSAATLLRVCRDLDDSGWEEVREWLLAWPAQWSLDETEYLWYPVRKMVTMVDARTEAGLAARLLGLQTAIPWPEYGGEGTWPEVTEGYLAELACVEPQDSQGPELTLADIAFLSDIGKSSALCLPQLFDATPRLLPDPFTSLHVRLPARGHVLTSMTAVALLTLDPVAGTTSERLTEAGVLLNPRLVELFCNDAGSVLPWWCELQQWRAVIAPWKASAPDAYLPGENDEYIYTQYRRSLDWSAYTDQDTVQRLRQDEDQLRSLLHFMERSWSS